MALRLFKKKDGKTSLLGKIANTAMDVFVPGGRKAVTEVWKQVHEIF